MPKSKYPFNSINFFNLIPICYPCNSGTKSSTDTLFDDEGKRVKAFFPFGGLIVEPKSIEIEIKNKELIIELMKSDDIEFKLPKDEFTKNWDRVFGIKKRYKNKVCKKTKEWLKEWQNTYRRTKGKYKIDEFIESRLYEYQDRPLHERYFLKYAIFNALNENGSLSQSLEEALHAMA